MSCPRASQIPVEKSQASRVIVEYERARDCERHLVHKRTQGVADQFEFDWVVVAHSNSIAISPSSRRTVASGGTTVVESYSATIIGPRSAVCGSWCARYHGCQNGLPGLAVVDLAGLQVHGAVLHPPLERRSQPAAPLPDARSFSG